MRMNKTPASIRLTRHTMPHPTIAQKDIAWKLGITAAERKQTVAVNTDVTFKWSGTHNVWLLPNKAAYDACDFSKAKELAFTQRPRRISPKNGRFRAVSYPPAIGVSQIGASSCRTHPAQPSEAASLYLQRRPIAPTEPFPWKIIAGLSRGS